MPVTGAMLKHARTKPKTAAMTEPRIDHKGGALVVGSRRLAPDLSEDQFLKSEGTAKLIQRTGTRHFYELWETTEGHEIGLTLRFAPRDKLERISLKFLRQGARASPWSKSLEEDTKRFHDTWLERQFGADTSIFGVPSYQFSWGRVTSLIEQPHVYSATIVIDYTCRGRRRLALILLARMADRLGLYSLGKKLRRAAR